MALYVKTLIKQFLRIKLTPELEKKYLGYKPRKGAYRLPFKIIHSPSWQMAYVLSFQCLLITQKVEIYSFSLFIHSVYCDFIVLIYGISFILCWVISKYNINDGPALVNVKDITPYKVTKSSIGLAIMSLFIAFSFWWYEVIFLDYVFLGIFLGVILRNIYLYLLKRDLLVKKERTKLVLFGLNEKVYYDHITGDYLFLLRHYRNFCIFSIIGLILFHSAHLNGFITDANTIDISMSNGTIFFNVMLYGVWRKFVHDHANPTLDQLMSIFDSIFSFLDTHEVEASGRKFIQDGAKKVAEEGLRQARDVAAEAAETAGNVPNRGSTGEIIRVAADSDGSPRPRAPNNIPGNTESVPVVDESNDVVPLPSEFGSGEAGTLTNSESQGGDPNDPPRTEPPRTEPPRNDSSGSNDSSGNPGATSEDENPPRGEQDMLGKEYLGSLFSSLGPAVRIISPNIGISVGLMSIQRYQEKLAANLSLHFPSPEPFWWITEQDLILKQLAAGWPCGALTLPGKTVVRLLMDFKHENKAQIMQDCLSINLDGTINSLETLELLLKLYGIVPDGLGMHLVERISLIDMISNAVISLGSFFG